MVDREVSLAWTRPVRVGTPVARQRMTGPVNDKAPTHAIRTQTWVNGAQVGVTFEVDCKACSHSPKA